MKQSVKRSWGKTCCVLLLLCGILLGCADGGRKPEETHTVMIYMIGADLEEEHGLASADILEMMGAGIDPVHTNILLYMSGAPQWLQAEEVQRNSLFALAGETLELLESYPAADMSLPETLASFLDYAIQEYPAEKYGLVLWDHGQGPIEGYGRDNRFAGSTMTLVDLREALRRSKLHGKQKLEWMAFDACLMGSLETAYAVKDYVHYMIASQEAVRAEGLDYSFLKSLSQLADGEQIGKVIIDTYNSYYEKQFQTPALSVFVPELTMSCADLNAVDKVIAALDDLCLQMLEGTERGHFQEFVRARYETKTFGRVSLGSEYDVIDIVDLAENMQKHYPEEAQSLLLALESLIAYNGANVEGANGLSLYYPYNNKSYFQNTARDTLALLGCADGYLAYLNIYADELLGESQTKWHSPLLKPYMLDDQTVALQLNEEQASDFVKASFFTFYLDGDATYVLLESTQQCTLDQNGVLRAPFAQSTIVFTGKSSGEKITATIMEIELREDYRVVQVPASNGGGPGVDDLVWLRIGIASDESDENVQILGAIPLQESIETLQTGKPVFHLEDWNSLYLYRVAKLATVDGQGNLLPYSDWEDYDGLYWSQLQLEDGFEIGIERRQDIEKPLYGLFIMCDAQANEHASDLILLKDAQPKEENQKKEPDTYAEDPPVMKINISSLPKKKPVIYEDDELRIRMQGLRHEVEYGNSLQLIMELSLENTSKDSVDISVEVADLYINDFKIEGYFGYLGDALPPGEVRTEKIAISRDIWKFRQEGIERLETMDILIQKRGEITKRIPVRLAMEYEIDELKENAPALRYASCAPINVEWETAHVTATVEAFYFDGSKYRLDILLKNSTARQVYFTLKDISFNNRMNELELGDGLYLEGGKKGYLRATVSRDSLFSIGLRELAEVEFEIAAKESFFSGKDLFRSDRTKLSLPLFVQEKVLFEGGGVKVSFKGIGPNNYAGETVVKICIENDTEKDIVIEALQCNVNDVKVQNAYELERVILAGKKLQADISIPAEALQNVDDEEVHMLLQLRVIDHVGRTIMVETPALHMAVEKGNA